jgi:hypothetical protein
MVSMMVFCCASPADVAVIWLVEEADVNRTEVAPAAVRLQTSNFAVQTTPETLLT